MTVYRLSAIRRELGRTKVLLELLAADPDYSLTDPPESMQLVTAATITLEAAAKAAASELHAESTELALRRRFIAGGLDDSAAPADER